MHTPEKQGGFEADPNALSEENKEKAHLELFIMRLFFYNNLITFTLAAPI